MHRLEPGVEQIIREAARAELIKEFDVKALLGAAGDMVRGLHVDMQNKYLSRARLNAAKKMTAEIDKLIAKYTAEFEKLGGTSDDALYAFATAYRHHAVNHAPAEDSNEATPTQTKEPHPAMAKPVPETPHGPGQPPADPVKSRAPVQDRIKQPAAKTTVMPKKQNKTVPMRSKL